MKFVHRSIKGVNTQNIPIRKYITTCCIITFITFSVQSEHTVVLPNPEPWGRRDQLWSSSPPPHFCTNCCSRDRGDDKHTASLHTHTAFNNAPAATTINSVFRHLQTQNFYIFNQVFKFLTGSMWLAVILQITEVFAHSLCSRAAARWSTAAHQHQLRF